MPDQIIVENCSPTLAGLKTASLFSLQTEKRAGNSGTVRDEIRKLNNEIRDKGLRAVPVRQTEKSTLIYLYRPDFLKRDFLNPEVRGILTRN